jgi:hypothetical protein
MPQPLVIQPGQFEFPVVGPIVDPFPPKLLVDGVCDWLQAGTLAKFILKSPN